MTRLRILGSVLPCFFFWVMTASAQVAGFAVVDGAGFQERAAPNILLSGFTPAIGDVRSIASSTPLPTELAGFSLMITDSTGVDRPAGLIGVFPGQANFVLPSETALGEATARLRFEGEVAAEGVFTVSAVAPGLFSMNSSGSGAPAGFAIRVAGDGSQTAEELFELDADAGMFVPRPFDLGPETDRVVLMLFGTGIRGRPALPAVTAEVDCVSVPVAFAGDQTQFEGLDQINTGELPRSLSGRGPGRFLLKVDGVPANVVDLSLEGPLLVPPPTLTAIEPAMGELGGTVSLRLSGENLMGVTGVAFAPAEGIEVTNVIPAEMSVDATVTISESAEPGQRTVTVISEDGCSSGIAFTVMEAMESLAISNLILDPRLVGDGVLFDFGFDFTAPEGNIVWTGDFNTSAKIEVVFTSDLTPSRCNYRLAGPPLDFPGVVSDTFFVDETPLADEEDGEMGEGMMTITLVDPDGNRSNSLQSGLPFQPVCAPDSGFQDVLFP